MEKLTLRVLILIVCTLLSGCVVFDIDKRAMTTLDIADDSKSFTVTEFWTDNQKASEVLVTKWVGEYVKDNKLCPNGFSKLSTRDIFLDKTILGIVSYKRIHKYQCAN